MAKAVRKNKTKVELTGELILKDRQERQSAFIAGIKELQEKFQYTLVAKITEDGPRLVSIDLKQHEQLAKTKKDAA